MEELQTSTEYLEQQLSLPLQCVPPGTQESQDLWQTDWWEPGLHNHCQVLQSWICIQKNLSIREQAVFSSTADISVTCRPASALCWHKLPADATGQQDTCIALACSCLRDSLALNCRKVQFCQCDTVNRSANMYSLAEHYPYAVWCFTAQKALLNPRGDWKYK